MRAVVCNSFGLPENLTLGNIDEIEAPKENKVLISVMAAGVNFPDTLIIQGKYQFQPSFSFTPGGEVAGIIKKVGPGVSGLKPGDRVFAGTGWGGFAEEVIAPASNTFLLPDNVDFKDGAVIAEAYGTSYHALVDRAQLKSNETLLVLGASGGVGIAAVQIGKALGARVTAAASTDEKLKFCIKHGADSTINYSNEDLKVKAKELTDGKGFDVIYDPIGAPYTEQALRATSWNGRYLIVGFAAGSIPQIPMNLPLLKGCSIVGVFWGGFFKNEPDRNRRNFKMLLELFASKDISPPIHKVYSLDQSAIALREIMDRKVMGKIVIDLQHA